MYSMHSQRKHKSRPNTTSRLAGNAIKRSNKLADRRDNKGKERQIVPGSV